MNPKKIFLAIFFALSTAQDTPRGLKVPDSSELQSLVASAQSRAGAHVSSVITDAESVLSKATSAIPSDLKSKVFATETLAAAADGITPNVAAKLALLNGAIGAIGMVYG
jgi:hypothetical protein